MSTTGFWKRGVTSAKKEAEKVITFIWNIIKTFFFSRESILISCSFKANIRFRCVSMCTFEATWFIRILLCTFACNEDAVWLKKMEQPQLAKFSANVPSKLNTTQEHWFLAYKTIGLGFPNWSPSLNNPQPNCLVETNLVSNHDQLTKLLSSISFTNFNGHHYIFALATKSWPSHQIIHHQV